MGKPVDLSYLGVDELVKIIRRKGRGCLLFKRDLSKCYRQIYMDPGSIKFLGFVMQGLLYFDVVLTMGLKVACYICERITSALVYIFKRLSYEGINYLDNLGGGGQRSKNVCGRHLLCWEKFSVI